MSEKQRDKLSSIYKAPENKQLAALFCEEMSSNDTITISAPDTCAASFFSGWYGTQTDSNILLVVSDSKQAEKIQRELHYFTSSDVPYLPSQEPDTDAPLFTSGLDTKTLRANWFYESRKSRFLICDIQTLIEKLPPQELLYKYTLQLQTGESIDRGFLESEIENYGYDKTDFVYKVGEYSRRGSIIDLFSPLYEHPIRIEFFGDTVNSLRFFSASDQKTRIKTERITVIPTTVFIVDKSNIDKLKESIKEYSNNNGVSAAYRNTLINNLESGKRPEFLQWLLPFAYDKQVSIFDYIGKDTVLIFYRCGNTDWYDDCRVELTEKLTLLRKKYKVIPDYESLYLSAEELTNKLIGFKKISISEIAIGNRPKLNLNFEDIKLAKTSPNPDSPLAELKAYVHQYTSKDYTVLFVLKSRAEINKFKELLEIEETPNILFDVGDLAKGFVSHGHKLLIITEKEIYRDKKHRKPQVADKTPSAFITSFSELKPCDYIVHKEFGIGIYQGLIQLDIKSNKADFLVCEYKDGDRIYVPVDKLHMVQRYVGEGKSPAIEKLGRETWAKTLKKVKRSVELIAKDLLELYARRKVEKGYQFSKNDKLFYELESSFEHEETSHQISAINDVVADMESPISMDRLICGDVGFGKTEVAIRAAFKAVMDGKQVTVIVPTTLLCFQHYLTFKSRLKDFPVNIEMISRFRTQAQSTKILKSLSVGQIDIIIGTHKLLGSRVEFKDLGLIIIDEEHKFGVKQKENIRKMKSSVDVLALSATPIPRTLQLSLANIRDISLINTPPEGRQAIETYVYSSSEQVIKKAIDDELKRGGAIFFIHNRIENIHSVASKISKIVPHVRYEVTHGRMKESILEKNINRFITGEIDMLITTTIVESGLDIPRANTIIINDAHTFGLADLYQLRGRVGRADKKAYAYFLVPGTEKLTDSSKQRLRAISELKELGSGFKLALSDLEIRGAGTLFGTEQSGHIADIGLEMYLEMLESAVKNLSNVKQEFEFEPEIKSSYPTFIPTEYVEDDSERLMMYKKLSTAKTHAELKDIYYDISDRFGKPPETVNNLFSLIDIKIYMKKYLIKKLELKKNNIVMEFLETSPLFDYFRPSGIYRITEVSDFSLIQVKHLISSFKTDNPPYLHSQRRQAH